jgi:hypothetical protein
MAVTASVKSPADPTARFTRRKTAISEFWAVATQRGAAANAARLFRDARRRDPQAFLFPELILNQLACTRLQDGDTDDAVELFTLNVEAYSRSASAQDSLADGYARTEQFAAAYYHVAMFGEVAQQLELAVRASNRPVSSRRVLVRKVNRHISQSYPADTRTGAAEDGPTLDTLFV